MGKNSFIWDLTESDRQKAITELYESDDLESRISSLRNQIKASEWFNPVFEERLDDQYLKSFLRVAKMDEDVALERVRKTFALQKGTDYRFTVSDSRNILIRCLMRALNEFNASSKWTSI